MLTPEQMAALQSENPEAIVDYIESLPDSLHEAERCVNLLQRNPLDIVQINTLFRALHSMKSNAAMCRLPTLVSFAHPIEDLVGEIRSGNLKFDDKIGELILLCADRLQLAAHQLSKGYDLTPLALKEIAEQIRRVVESDPSCVQKAIEDGIALLSGYDVHSDVPPETALQQQQNGQEVERDMEYFRDLALRLEHRNPYFEGRTQRTLDLARATNALAGYLVDARQLDAAVYMHDVGMAFLPDELIGKQGRYTDMEMREMKHHPVLAAGLLVRMPGWEEAARIVRQHHERVDSTGYPAGLVHAHICEGAKLLAVVDAFEAMTHERGDRYQKKSILRAVTELNACGHQFDIQWVKIFNQVARKLMTQPETV